METIVGYLLVFLGGGLGAAVRHGVNRAAFTLSPNFPAGTMAINILGCFLMGMVIGWLALRGQDVSTNAKLLLTTGILGGFTTFSAFSLDAAYLWQRGETMNAVLYVVGSAGLSLIAVFTGLALMRNLLS